MPPVVNNQTRVLIVGSMPGEQSLHSRQYYANPRNQFWRLIYAMLGQHLHDRYEDRTAFLLSHQLGLWDVLASCERDGSLDSSIKGEEVNDFDSMFTQYPSIRYMVFNGSKAYDSFRRKIGFRFPAIEAYVAMPSTSPANTMKWINKLADWQRIALYLD